MTERVDSVIFRFNNGVQRGTALYRSSQRIAPMLRPSPFPLAQPPTQAHHVRNRRAVVSHLRHAALRKHLRHRVDALERSCRSQPRLARVPVEPRHALFCINLRCHRRLWRGCPLKRAKSSACSRCTNTRSCRVVSLRSFDENFPANSTLRSVRSPAAAVPPGKRARRCAPSVVR